MVLDDSFAHGLSYSKWNQHTYETTYFSPNRVFKTLKQKTELKLQNHAMYGVENGKMFFIF